ncbi:hypothetical protein AB0L56_11520 [Streptomyces sp. NPDC052079]
MAAVRGSSPRRLVQPPPWSTRMRTTWSAVAADLTGAGSIT